MKPYEQLTLKGKLRRLRGLAEEALQQFGVTAVRLKLIGTDTNLIYRVWAEDGQQFALRIANPKWRGVDTAAFHVNLYDHYRKTGELLPPKLPR